MTPDLWIDRYFQLATQPDRAPYFELFTDDAVLTDDGHTHQGIEAIRAWRVTVPSVRYDVQTVTPEAEDLLAVTEVTGDFPGSPVTLQFRFTLVDDGRIDRLVIEP
jgi:hypothetical protein